MYLYNIVWVDSCTPWLYVAQRRPDKVLCCNYAYNIIYILHIRTTYASDPLLFSCTCVIPYNLTIHATT